MKVNTIKMMEEMKRLGYSQNTFAPHVGLTRQAIGYILKTGKTKLDTLGKIADALGMEAKDLLV